MRAKDHETLAAELAIARKLRLLFNVAVNDTGWQLESPAKVLRGVLPPCPPFDANHNEVYSVHQAWVACPLSYLLSTRLAASSTTVIHDHNRWEALEGRNTHRLCDGVQTRLFWAWQHVGKRRHPPEAEVSCDDVLWVHCSKSERAEARALRWDQTD